jgi:regulator of sigma E protease
MSILAAIVVLGFLILIHELGHFAAAKLAGIGVERFSIGFGPKLLGWTRGETEYRLSAFPIGGYVKMVGQDPFEAAVLEGASAGQSPAAPETAAGEAAPIDPARSFMAKPIWKRIMVVGAGPVCNLLLAVIIFAIIFSAVGVQVLTDEIGEVQDGKPAQAAGLRPGDRITAVDGTAVPGWEELTTIIHGSPDKLLRLTVRRGGEELAIEVTPRRDTLEDAFGTASSVGLIGIKPRYAEQRLGPVEAVGLAFTRTWEIIVLTFVVIGKIFQRVVPASTIGGPIMMVQMAGEGARAGWLSFVSLVALLSINLGIFNLLPIPILDGGHILFFLVEGVRGRPVSIRKREIIQQIGLFVILAIFVFAFYNDIHRLATGFLAK